MLILLLLISNALAFPGLPFGQKCKIFATDSNGLAVTTLNGTSKPFSNPSFANNLILAEDVKGIGSLRVTTDFNMTLMPADIIQNLTVSVAADGRSQSVDFFYDPIDNLNVRYTNANGEVSVKWVGSTNLFGSTRHETLGNLFSFRAIYSMYYAIFTLSVGHGVNADTVNMYLFNYQPSVSVIDVTQGNLFSHSGFTHQSGLCA